MDNIASLIYNKYKTLLDKGIITKSEAIFMFQKLVMEYYTDEEAFEICTNIEF